MSTHSAAIERFSHSTVQAPLAMPPVTGVAAMDQAVARVRDASPGFARLPLSERIALARSMQAGYRRIAEASVHAGCTAKGIDVAGPAAGEEWATGPWSVVRHLRLLRESLQALARSGDTPIQGVGDAADGRLTVRVFPGSAIDRMLFKDVVVDVHMRAGVGPAQLEGRARFYKQPDHDGRAALVLGAGNIASIGPMDVCTKLFNEGKACVLKMHPVNAYLGPFIEQAFAEAIRRGFLAVVYGGAEEGAYLVEHPGVDEIHITGSHHTYNRIVWGPPGPEREARMDRNEPLLRKPITAELGNVSPVIVVPGPYSEKELRFQAEDLVSSVTMNASFLCNSNKMLVTPLGWGPAVLLRSAVARTLEGIPPRAAYYPGAAERWKALTARRESIQHIGKPGPGCLPWTIVRDLDPGDGAEPLFRTEPFCTLLSEVELGNADPVEFLDRAVEFANSRLWGTLSATLVVHPKSLRDPAVGRAVEDAIRRLRYGTVAVNGFPGLAFAFASPPWGAFPGASPADIQSGSGWVHNTPMLEGVDKAVIRYPLTSFPKPGYFATHRSAQRVLRHLVDLDMEGSWLRVPPVVVAAVGG